MVTVLDSYSFIKDGDANDNFIHATSKGNCVDCNWRENGKRD